MYIEIHMEPSWMRIFNLKQYDNDIKNNDSDSLNFKLEYIKYGGQILLTLNLRFAIIHHFALKVTFKSKKLA